MATARNKKGKKTQQHCGDVCAIDPIGFPLTDLITIELKRGYSRHTITDLLDKPKKAAKQVYEKWIEQAEKAARGAGTPCWLLVVKRDHREPIVFMKDRSWFPSIVSFELGNFILGGTTLETFFTLVNPDRIRSLNERSSRLGMRT